MDPLKNYKLGILGVNVDKDEILLDDAELRQAQNAIREPLGGVGGIRKRPGLTPFNVSNTADRVLGGVSVPLVNESASGTSNIYIGRRAA
jgi:hypothetical protein